MIVRATPVLLALLLTACGNAGRAPEASATPAAAASTMAPASAASSAVPDSPEPAGEKPVPEFPALVVETFDGGRFDLAAHRGQWVVVNFWATWCKPCLKEIPDLAAMDAAREDVVVVGLAYEEIERADMEAFLTQRPIPYPIAIVDTYGPPTDFGIPRGLPTTFLVSPEGKVAATHLGPVTSKELLDEIAAGGAAK